MERNCLASCARNYVSKSTPFQIRAPPNTCNTASDRRQSRATIAPPAKPRLAPTVSKDLRRRHQGCKTSKLLRGGVLGCLIRHMVAPESLGLNTTLVLSVLRLQSFVPNVVVLIDLRLVPALRATRPPVAFCTAGVRRTSSLLTFRASHASSKYGRLCLNSSGLFCRVQTVRRHCLGIAMPLPTTHA